MARCQDVISYALSVGQTAMYESALGQYETYQAEYDERMARRLYQEHLEKSPDGTIEIGEINDTSPLRGDTVDGKSNNRGQPQKRK